MRQVDPIRLRGTIVAVFVLVGIAIIYSYLETEPVSTFVAASPAASDAQTASLSTTSTTIPVTNRLCGLTQRTSTDAFTKSDIDAAKVLEGFYAEAASFTEGAVKANLAAAARYYKDLVAIGTKGNWDVATIVRNKDGERWRQLVAANPTGVNEARADLEQLCRARLPEPPLLRLDADGRISDPRLRSLLDPVDKELPPSVAVTTTTRPRQ